MGNLFSNEVTDIIEHLVKGIIKPTDYTSLTVLNIQNVTVLVIFQKDKLEVKNIVLTVGSE